MQKRNLFIFLFLFIFSLGAVFRLFNLVYFHALDTDEAIYAQIVFAITKGFVLYKDIGFVHPPVYPSLEYAFILISPSLFTLRLFNVILGMAILYLIFRICKMLYSMKIALLASAIYAFYPLAIRSNKLALIDNGLTFFVVLTMGLFATYLKERNVKYLFLAGLFAGISFMTKYTALLFIFALFLFIALRVSKKKFTHLFLFTATTAVFPLAILVFLFVIGLWPYFFTQTINWHLIRFGMPLPEKFWFFSQIIISLLPLLLLAIPTVLSNCRDWRAELIMTWFFVPFGMLAFSKIVFLHYSFSLLPPISLLAAISIDRYILSIFRHRTLNSKFFWKITAALLTTILVVTFIGRFVNVFYGAQWFFVEGVFGTSNQMAYTQAQMEVSDYIKNITNPNDTIWSSDASFGFLSQRLMVAPESQYWKFQGFFQDVWGYGWTLDDYRGPIPGYPNGLFTLENVLDAWKKEEPTVILVLRTSWVDYLIWNGINNTYHKEEGLLDYIRSNYNLSSKFYNQTIEVWIRNTLMKQYLIEEPSFTSLATYTPCQKNIVPMRALLTQ